MDKITEGQKVLAIWSQSPSEDLKNFVNQIKCTAGDGNFFLENSDIISMNSHPQSTFDVILSNLIPPHAVVHSDNFLSILLNVLKPNGQLILKDKSDNITSQLILNGFVDPTVDGENIVCGKPNFEVGSAYKLGTKLWKISGNVESVWGDDENDEIIDSDMLLDENDLKKPEPAPLKVCGTTGQRKACADCSCGLAEELRGEVKEQPKSSCGSCYLGDAFRCASCPYLGTPAFKPGEKVLLADLKPDI